MPVRTLAPHVVVDNTLPPPTADLAGLSSADIARELASISTRRNTTKLEIWFWAGVLGIAAIAVVVIVGLFMRAV
jgi:hypothetical protein